MVQVLGFIVLMFSGGLVWAQTSENPVTATINFQNDTVHLELTGRSNWKYGVNRKDRKILLELDSLDTASATRLKEFKNSLVTSIEVQKDKVVGRDLIIFNVDGAHIEHFDYLTDEPSRLIVDFYVNPEMQKARPVPQKKTSSDKDLKPSSGKRTVASDASAIKIEGGKVSAEPLNPFGLFDGADPDFERFAIRDYEIKEDSIIKSRDRLYIHFPWLLRPPRKWSEVLAAGTVYHVHPKTTDENKEMRLLQRLFDKKRNRVFLQTAAWFNGKYPRSEYKEIIDFMKADVRWRLYEGSQSGRDFDRAIQAYRQALMNHPKSPMAERISLMVGIRLFEKNDFINSLRAFNQHIETERYGTEDSLSKDLARLGVGLSYMHLKRYTEAQEALRNLEKKSLHNEVRHEASYHLGDLNVLSKEYSKAIADYRQSQTQYPDASLDFPNSFYNLAEAEFWTGNYKKALESYREFIKKFPSDEHVPFALTRIGETLEILGADKPKVMGAYLETYFRYGDSPKALIARIRMTAARMKGMKPKEVELATAEILNLSKKTDLDGADRLATVLISEGYSERGDFDNAINLLISHHQKNPTMPDADHLKRRIVSNINYKLKELADKKNFIELFKLHKKYSDVWLKNSNRLDTRYYLGKAFEVAGVPAESERYYREALNLLHSIEGTAREKEARVVQDLPSKESLYLRMAKVQIFQKKHSDAYESLKNIKKVENLNQDEQIERVILTAGLLAEKEQWDSARRFVMELLRTWKGEPEKLEAPYFKLAEIEMKTGQNEEALKSLKKIDEIYKDVKVTKDDIHFRSLERRMELAESLKNDDESLMAANRLLEIYEDTRSVASIRYKLGEIYFRKGLIKKAEVAWTGFKGAQSDFWSQLAQEQMSSMKWRDEYKRYMNRIPAMSRDGGTN